MSISGVSSSNLFSLADLGGTSGVDQTSATVSFSDFPPPPPRHHGGGGDFIDAIKQALASLEADTATSSTVTTSSTDNTTSTQNVDAALNSFLQNLLTALHSESASNSNSTTDSSTDDNSVTSASAVAAATASSAAAAANRPPPPPGGGRLEEDLTKLVQSLSASESSTSSTDTASASDSSTSGSSSSTNTDLESSFANLLSALGDAGGTSLSSFLQSITTKLHATPSSGNIINTTA
ncbi:hypothetical protein [Herbaspirillum rhizosphaerae]|uniref:hypothetical protein n=1 Tax=Herbaspirillum rhizosphaerae TaxID=346179 RepID=UPI00067ADD56|nr:hypothetical protein [Herbaspirillum rhizosphaerae]